MNNENPWQASVESDVPDDPEHLTATQIILLVAILAPLPTLLLMTLFMGFIQR